MVQKVHVRVVGSRIRGAKRPQIVACSRCGRDIEINTKRPPRSSPTCSDCRQVDPKWAAS